MSLSMDCAERITIRGLVQGVGFRPSAWRLAQRHHVRGWVANDALGVAMHVAGQREDLDAFVHALVAEAPPLARIEHVEREPAALLPADAGFVIAPSSGASAGHRSGVVPDAATCAECLRELRDPRQRRYRYPFTNCTHCGPRLSIVSAIPYDRVTTTMRGFAMCADCAREYADPGDRRFHAQPIACPACGPRVRLEPGAAGDPIDAAAALIDGGAIVAVKGLGGYQLACDAANAAAVARLRRGKRREGKPFALIVRDLEVLRRWCRVSLAEQALLEGAAAPIVILDRRADAPPLAPAVAPGIGTLGAMLPATPLHHRLLERFDRPLVLTSGNLSDEPQCISDDDVRERLAGIADAWLAHDRGIERRLDDSVLRVVAGAPRLLRRARGFAPAPLRLPPGFEDAPPVLAVGGELKNTFCLLQGGEAIVSHHIGDLDDAATLADFVRALGDYEALFEHRPQRLAADLHPDSLAGRHAEALAEAGSIPLVRVQHHHAHVASCLAEAGWPLDAGLVLGIALDGLGFGADGTPWGGEFLAADYRRCERLAALQPVAMPGGDACAREPWRNTYAHLTAAIGWQRFAVDHAGSDLQRFLAAQPLAMLDSMLAADINSPRASSCGRLFDAVAAAAGIRRERVLYEGQAAIEFEACVDRMGPIADDGYPFSLAFGDGLPTIVHRPMWQALLADLRDGAGTATIAARFHNGLAAALAAMAGELLARAPGRFHAIALSGGVFQNRVLLERLLPRLAALGLPIVTHRHLPCHDGGLSLGQATVAAALA
ncbi:MAG TPA: carbamoyltransferase HypF [Burkholderiaceae bacterium]|nr:carbamoyltransferase HypF [Burkholderiaceae bacterium]